MNNNLYYIDILGILHINMIELGKELIQVQTLPLIDFKMIDNITKPKKKIKTLKTFEVGLDNFYGSKYYEYIIANSYSQARYKFWYEHRDSLKSFKECMSMIKVYSRGKCKPEYFFSNQNDFDRMKELRNIDFAYMGQRVKIYGKMGTITGCNEYLNLNVWFDGSECTDSNCHPYSQITYFDLENNIIKKYK